MTQDNPFFPHDYAVAASESGPYAAEGNVLYRWCGTHWDSLSDQEAERKAYAWLLSQDKEWASASNAKRAIRALCLYAPALPELTDKVVVPTRSGYVHLVGSDLVLHEPDPALGLTHCLACDYVPNAPCPPGFAAFLQRVLPDPAVAGRVQEYIGYTLMPDARYQRAQFWLGEGANGKGVLANIVQALHGRVAAMALDQLSGFALSALVGANLIYVDEVPRKPFDEQRLKSMIAGERIPIDRKYREPLSVAVRGKWLVLGNHLPAITDHSVGFWRRWDVVPFAVTIPERERDPQLAERVMREELSGVLNWALDGLVRLLKRGGFDPVVPEPMRLLMREAKTQTNSVVAWMEDLGVGLGDAANTPKDAVFAHYRAWCTVNAMPAVNAVQFWKRLREHFPQLAEHRMRTADGQRRFTNVQLPLTGTEGMG